MKRLTVIAVVATSTLVAAPLLAEQPRVFHVPAVEGRSGEAIELVAEVERGWSAELEVQFRSIGEATWKRAPFERRSETSYRAQINGLNVAPPGLEYFISSFSGEGDISDKSLHFGSANTPHPIYVRDDSAEVLAQHELARFDNRRASFRISGEYVDFGSRKSADERTIRDRYYRAEADFTYRLFRFPLRAFRLGFTQMLGDTPITGRGLDGCPEPCEQSAGFRAGGWAELRWRLSSLIDVDTRVLIQATPDGFGVGGRGELRFGDETATHFSLGGEAITEVGTNFFVRLGWSTVPMVPMAASIELTDYPSAHRDHGVRLVYDIAYDAGFGVRIGGRVGYQARDQNIGGVSGGLNATLDF